MGNSLEKLREIEKRIDFALERPNLDKWSRTFLRDIRVRIAKYGTNVRFSAKQAKALSRLIDLHVAIDSVSSPWGQGKVVAFRNAQSLQPLIAPGQKSRQPSRGSIRAASCAVIFGLACAGAAYPVVKYLVPSYDRLSSLDIRVIDGDTIAISGAPQNVRLVGFNTPETAQPLCAQERILGAAATDRLKQLVATNELEFAYERCACPPGMAGTPDCNFGRLCGSLRANGEDVGVILGAEGLAVPFSCGWMSCPPLPRPWCGETDLDEPAVLIGSSPSNAADCVIKGNISLNSGERIYHVPGQEYYDDTRVQPEHGERWFCTEEEARAAGWRRARR